MNTQELLKEFIALEKKSPEMSEKFLKENAESDPRFGYLVEMRHTMMEAVNQVYGVECAEETQLVGAGATVPNRQWLLQALDTSDKILSSLAAAVYTNALLRQKLVVSH